MNSNRNYSLDLKNIKMNIIKIQTMNHKSQLVFFRLIKSIKIISENFVLLSKLENFSLDNNNFQILLPSF